MAIYFSADPHFGHENIICYSGRPFQSAAEMDQLIIDCWNAQVGAEDTLYCLGDWCCGVGRDKAGYAGMIRSRLNAGRIILIRGNHDPAPGKNLAFDAVFDRVHELLEITVAKRRITLCHYAMTLWNECHKGSLHCFGHSHGNYSATNRSMDVGVDTNDFKVYDVLDVIARLEQRPVKAVDHHNELTT